MFELKPGHFRYPAISLQSAEVGVTKRDSKSIAYENRTKTAKCGGLETNGPRERISPFNTLSAVRRFSHEPLGYWRFHCAKTRRRLFVAGELAERKGFKLWVRFELRPIVRLTKMRHIIVHASFLA